MRRAAWLVCAIAVVGGCGSKKKKSGESASPTPAAGSAQTAAAGTAPVPPTGDLVWNEVPAKFPTGPKVPDLFVAPPPPPIGDPDAVIARYSAECPHGPASEPCKDLKRKVERILLETILDLRSVNQPIDRKWWRVAASADLPQLACQGVSALVRQKDRTPDENAAIVAALEHPAPSVRWAASTVLLPEIEPVLPRFERGDRKFAGNCIDGHTDRAYDLRWAGGYPTARFRYFASSPSKRWFTTTDSVEKVTEFFTKAGRPPLTADAIQTEMQQKMAAEVQRITQTMKEGEAEKASVEVQALASKFVAPHLSVNYAGEIRYVMLTSNIGIAIFKDDALKATSIVALAPPPIATPEAVERQEQARQVYGF